MASGLLVVAFVDVELASTLAVPMLAMAVAGLAACAVLYRRAAKANGGEPIHLKNPVSLSSAFEFALIFAAVMVGSRLASHYLGSAGTYAAALIAGTTDMDAIALSLAEMAGPQVSFPVAATGVVLADGAVAERWKAATGTPLVEGYGLTETAPIPL